MDIEKGTEKGKFHSGRKLQSIRKFKGLTLSDLSSKFCVEVNTIQKWQFKGIPENNKSDVADFLGIDVQLLDDDNITEEDLIKYISKPKVDILSQQQSVESKNKSVPKDYRIETIIADYVKKIQPTKSYQNIEKKFISLEMLRNITSEHTEIDELLDVDGDWSDYDKIFQQEFEYKKNIDDPIYLFMVNDTDDENETKDVDNVYESIVFNSASLINQELKFVLTGEPGSGKTTFLNYYLITNLKNYKTGGKISFFIPLSKYQPDKFYPKLSIKNFICDKFGFSYPDLDELFESNRIILLLDGYNECPLQYRDNCIYNIRLLLRSHPGLSLILTSRTANWDINLGLPVYTLQPLNSELQVSLLSKYIGDIESSKNIINKLTNQPGGKFITGNPWILFMVAKIFLKSKDIPKGNALIFRQYIQLEEWYEREFKKAKRSGISLEIMPDNLFEILCQIAANMRLNGYIKEAPISWIKDNILENSEVGEIFFNVISNGLICYVNYVDQTFSFYHETLQEYLAAEYIIKYPNIIKELDAEKYQFWGLIIAYAFELMGKNVNEELVLYGWRLNPLLVAITVPDKKIIKNMEIPQHFSPFMKETLDLLIDNIKPNYEAYSSEYKEVPLPQDVYYFARQEVKYALHTDYSGLKKLSILLTYWEKVPKIIDKIIIGFSYDWKNIPINKDVLTELFIKSEHRKRIYKYISQFGIWESISDKIRNVVIDDMKHYSLISIMIRYHLIDIDILLSSIYIDINDMWDYLEQLINKTVASKKEIFQKVPFHCVLKLMDFGYSVKSDFTDRIPEWIIKANFVQSIEMIKYQMATKDDFIDKIPEWINYKSIGCILFATTENL